MSALDIQIGGTHYRDCAIQPIQYIEANNLKFLEACVIKRCTRHDKPTGKGRQDIEKAIHELQLLLDMRYPVEIKAEPLTADELEFDEDRADIIGQNGNDGEHYAADPGPLKYMLTPDKDGMLWDRKSLLRAMKEGYSIYLPDTEARQWKVTEEQGRFFVLVEVKRISDA